ncbi:MAG: hypothetical protein K0U24_02515 [Gammaproteobacteria bacterium]|nr:hypothetical protein [Gammaproteobacteria bacterium]MCH9763094.1 hypothetical protein [Gammaproteobacteria bacterium]
MKKIALFPLLLVWSNFAAAGDIGAVTPSKKLLPMASFQGGYACIDASRKSQQFTGTDSNLYTYAPSNSSCDAGFYGVFLGGERFLRDVSSHPVFLQLGLEYNNFSKIKISGTNTVGVDASSSTQYAYQFNTKVQQVLAGIKLLTTTKERYHPYAEGGLGIAFNRTGSYSTSTTDTGSLNFTPEFVGGNDMKFSAILGLGLDANVYQHVRVGLGYRFSYFNTATLGNGTVNLASASASTSKIPVSFKPSASYLYANQLLGHITYVA